MFETRSERLCSLYGPHDGGDVIFSNKTMITGIKKVILKLPKLCKTNLITLKIKISLSSFKASSVLFEYRQHLT